MPSCLVICSCSLSWKAWAYSRRLLLTHLLSSGSSIGLLSPFPYTTLPSTARAPTYYEYQSSPLPLNTVVDMLLSCLFCRLSLFTVAPCFVYVLSSDRIFGDLFQHDSCDGVLPVSLPLLRQNQQRSQGASNKTSKRMGHGLASAFPVANICMFSTIVRRRQRCKLLGWTLTELTGTRSTGDLFRCEALMGM